MQPRVLFFLVFTFAGFPGYREAGADQLVELDDGRQKHIGRIMAFDETRLWIQEPNGSLSLLEKSGIRSFSQRRESFRLLSATDLRGEIRKELGTSFEVRGTGHYLVCGKSRTVDQYAQIFEEVYRAFFRYFSVRNIPLEEPGQPLVAIVLPNRSGFADYALRDGVQAGRGLAGYYLRTSNRVALFEDDSRAMSEPPREGDPESLTSLLVSRVEPPFQGLESRRAYATIQGSLRDTIIHEATHQVAFNTGVHNRMCDNPKWFVEGLACVFEAPGIRQADPSGKVSVRVNHDRLKWFKSYRRERRPAENLKNITASDEAFAISPLDAYAEAWALTFFLIETRRREYSTYIRAVSSRAPLEDYSASKRIADFESSFGKDWKRLEAAYLRYLDELSL